MHTTIVAGRGGSAGRRLREHLANAADQSGSAAGDESGLGAGDGVELMAILGRVCPRVAGRVEILRPAGRRGFGVRQRLTLGEFERRRLPSMVTDAWGKGGGLHPLRDSSLRRHSTQ